MTQEKINPVRTGIAISISRQTTVFLHSVLFVLGFSMVFVVGWGGAATLLGRAFADYKDQISQIGGIVIIVFGLHTTGILGLRWLNYDIRPQWTVGESSNLLSSTLMGVFFAAGWTPCIGTTLGAILTLGFSQETSGQALVLSGGYALGLGIPFLAMGLVMARANQIVYKIRPYIRPIQIISGLLQIAIGIMLLTDSLYVIAIWAQRNGFFIDLELGGGITPSFPVAILAGTLSFLSPCVLPLVPAYLGYLSRQVVK